MKNFVSVIVPTKNSEKTIEVCLKSIKDQTYKDIEIVVVDNNSSDKTKEIARKHTSLVFNRGPERSSQRNFGAERSKGNYLLFIDSDMELEKDVVDECVKKALSTKSKLGGIIIPEKSFGTGFWAKCKELERSFYEGIDWIEAARFFSKNIFEELGGFDEKLVSGEDWDLSQRVEEKYKIQRIRSYILHNEQNLSLFDSLKKKYYYAKKIKNYKGKNANDRKYQIQSSAVARYKLFFASPKKLFKHPFVGLGMLFMKTSEFGVGAIGYFIG